MLPTLLKIIAAVAAVFWATYAWFGVAHALALAAGFAVSAVTTMMAARDGQLVAILYIVACLAVLGVTSAAMGVLGGAAAGALLGVLTGLYLTQEYG